MGLDYTEMDDTIKEHGRPNVFLGLKRNLNRSLLSAFRENKAKLTKKFISSLN